MHHLYLCFGAFILLYIRDHSYITSALKGGEGGRPNAYFCWRGGEGGYRVMLTSSCHFVKRAKKITALRAFFLSLFFALDKRILKNPKSIKKTLTFSTLFRNFSKFALASQKNYLLLIFIVSILLEILNIPYACHHKPMVCILFTHFLKSKNIFCLSDSFTNLKIAFINIF